MLKLAPRHAWLPFLLISLLVIALAWSIAFQHVRDAEAASERSAASRAQALARTHAEQASLTLTIADETLRHLRASVINAGDDAFMREAVRLSGPGAGGPINRAALIGADGMMRANYLDGKPVALTNVTDRPYFADLKRDGTDRIFVTEPILGKVSGEWIVLFARPILLNGKFDGVIFVGFPAGRLGHLFDAVDRNSEVVTLLSPQGRIVARSSARDEHTGKRLDLPKADGADSFSFISPLDRHRRIVSVRDIPDWGMRVAAGIDMDVIGAETDRLARITFLPAALLTLLLLPAAFLIHRANREQIAAHDALQMETRRSRKVFQSIAEGILLMDETGRIGFANDAASRWLPDWYARRLDELLAGNGYCLVTEDATPYVGSGPDLLPGLGVSREGDAVWLWRGGDEPRAIWLALGVRLLHDADGAINGATLSLTDRSDEHERLTESALTAGILEDMHDAVMITDAGGRIIRTNRAFGRLTGYRDDEVRGRTPNLLKSGRHNAAFFDAMWQSLQTQGHWSGRVWNRRKTGEEFCVWHSITSIRDERGRTVRYIAVSRDITRQEAHENQLWQRANFDPLTGLANRSRFDDRLAQAYRAATRHGYGFALLYLDLDHFKPVNDTLGHAAGDALLRQVAQRMRSVLREEDTLARIGGDEFALLLPRAANAGITARVSGKILDVIRAPFDLAEGTANIGVSIGIALFPEDGSDAAALCTAADLALYAAKAGGRNCWRFHEHNDQEEDA